MKGLKESYNAPRKHLFDLNDMNDEEKRSMFMTVAVKSLDTWLAYYEGKEQYEICQLIKDIREYRTSGTPAHI